MAFFLLALFLFSSQFFSKNTNNYFLFTRFDYFFSGWKKNVNNFLSIFSFSSRSFFLLVVCYFVMLCGDMRQKDAPRTRRKKDARCGGRFEQCCWKRTFLGTGVLWDLDMVFWGSSLVCYFLQTKSIERQMKEKTKILRNSFPATLKKCQEKPGKTPKNRNIHRESERDTHNTQEKRAKQEGK